MYQRHLLLHAYLKCVWIINSVSHACHPSILLLFILHICHWCNSLKFLSLVSLYYEILSMCAQRINSDMYALSLKYKAKEVIIFVIAARLHPCSLYMQRWITTQDVKRSSKAILLRISMQCDYHQSYAGAQGAKPMKMVLIRKLVFMVTGSYCDVTYAKRATCVCVCVCASRHFGIALSVSTAKAIRWWQTGGIHSTVDNDVWRCPWTADG